MKAQAAGLAKADIEFQMLFGMAEELRDASRAKATARASTCR